MRRALLFDSSDLPRYRKQHRAGVATLAGDRWATGLRRVHLIEVCS